MVPNQKVPCQFIPGCFCFFGSPIQSCCWVRVQYDDEDDDDEWASGHIWFGHALSILTRFFCDILFFYSTFVLIVFPVGRTINQSSPSGSTVRILWNLFSRALPYFCLFCDLQCGRTKNSRMVSSSRIPTRGAP